MRLTMLFSGALFAVVLLTAGCSERAGAAPRPAAFKASCNNIHSLSTCTDYTDYAFALGEGFVKGACEATSGTYSPDHCPGAELVGTCALEGGQTRKYYSAGTMRYSAAEAERDCQDSYSGKWAMR